MAERRGDEDSMARTWGYVMPAGGVRDGFVCVGDIQYKPATFLKKRKKMGKRKKEF